MLAALLWSPLQSIASVYTAKGMDSMTMSSSMPHCEHAQLTDNDCQHHEQVTAQNHHQHCSGNMDCSQHCNSCAHCQFFTSKPFTLQHVQQTRVDRGSDIGFASHIPQVDIRPPRFS